MRRQGAGALRRLAIVSVLVAVVALVYGAVGRAAGDPEPTINTNVQYNIPPGPGWPKGWTPPPVPTELPKSVIDVFDFGKSRSNDPNAPQRLEMRVVQPLPAWTKEYPYVWAIDMGLQCGSTLYAFFYPSPDQELLHKTYGDGYTFGGIATDPVHCMFTPVTHIEPTHRITAEEKEQLILDGRMGADARYARLKGSPGGELQDCLPDLHDGSPEKIYVCFNSGSASKRFDAPAYLDTEVGRVRVPVRFVSEMMRAEVAWDPDAQTVTIHFPAVARDVVMPTPMAGYKLGDLAVPDSYDFDSLKYKLAVHSVSRPERTIVLTVGKGSALVDGREVPLDAPPVLVPPGRTMVPVRFIAEAMGAKVYWVGENPIWKKDDGSLGGRYQVHIYTALWPFFEYPNWYLETRAQKF